MEGTKRFKDWMEDMDIYVVTRNDPDRMKSFAMGSLKGAAKQMLKRFLDQNPKANWDDIQTYMKSLFSDNADEKLASIKL